MKNVIQLIVVLFLAMQLHAQERTITGTVTTDFDGLPLPGATVLIKGTSEGANTNFDGKYVIKAKPEDELVYSFLGYTTVTKKVGNALVIDVAMLVDSTTLDEVVIVSAYGRNVKHKVMSSVTIVNAEQIEKGNTISQHLSGQAVGVNVNTSTSQPGQSPTITIRGRNSIIAD